MKKILFLIFTDDFCKVNHAFMYANDMHEKGYQVKIIIEGAATQFFNKIFEKDSTFSNQYHKAKNADIIVGACASASVGCATADPTRDVSTIVKNQELSLIDDLNGHAGIEQYIKEDYQILIF